jgi:hypothetical protein
MRLSETPRRISSNAESVSVLRIDRCTSAGSRGRLSGNLSGCCHSDIPRLRLLDVNESGEPSFGFRARISNNIAENRLGVHRGGAIAWPRLWEHRGAEVRGQATSTAMTSPGMEQRQGPPVPPRIAAARVR